MSVRISTSSPIMAAAILKAEGEKLRGPVLARDEAKGSVADRRAFARVRRAEITYARQLRKIAHHVGHVIKAFPVNDPKALPKLQKVLADYAKAIEPWAHVVAEKMIAEVSRRDRQAWEAYSADMSRLLRHEINTAPTGATMMALLNEQVAYITSLPLEAAARVHDLTVEGMYDATRAKTIAKEIARSGEVTASRANLIARTEVARTASALVQSRAEYVGSEGYIWRDAGDSDVREEHRKLDGKYVLWSRPPIAGPKGERYHAGQGPNCRCYPEPVIPEFKADVA